MKKRSLFLAIASLLSVISPLTACSCSKNKNDVEKGGLGVVEMFYDFENYERNLAQLRTFGSFGVVSENREIEYVSEGLVSCKLQPLGAKDTTSKPYIVFPTYSPIYDYNYTNFNNYRQFTGDFYNAEEKEVKVDIGLATSTPTYLRDEKNQWMETSVSNSVTLKPGWNKIVYTIEHDLLGVAKNLNEIYGIFLAFENAGSRFAKDAVTIYVDNFKLEKLETAHVKAEKFDVKTTEEKDGNGNVVKTIYEVCSFDKAYQQYMVWGEQYRHTYVQPDFEIFNPMLGDEIGSVMRINTRSVLDLGKSNYPQCFLAGAMVRQHDTAQFLADITAENPEYEYYFCFDAYNNSATSFSFNIYFTDTDRKSSVSTNFTLVPNEWVKCEVNLGKQTIKDVVDAEGNPKLYLSDVGDVKFTYERYVSEERREFWLDNVRIEKRKIVNTEVTI